MNMYDLFLRAHLYTALTLKANTCLSNIIQNITFHVTFLNKCDWMSVFTSAFMSNMLS